MHGWPNAIGGLWQHLVQSNGGGGSNYVEDREYISLLVN
jgi:hypothetical protein